MSMVTVATLFKYLLMPNESGIVNYLLGFLGISPKLWLNGAATARESLVAMAIWKGIGYNIILFLPVCKVYQENFMKHQRLMGPMSGINGFILQFHV